LRSDVILVISDHISPLGKQHLHEECVVWGVALHVLEIKEVFSSLSHISQVGQKTQHLVEFIRNTLVTIDAVLVQGISNLVVAFLHMTSVP
jgi:hypothetical protein